MFGRRYYGARHFGPRYFGDGADAAPPPAAWAFTPPLEVAGIAASLAVAGNITIASGGEPAPGDGALFGRRYFGARFFGARYWGSGSAAPTPPPPAPSPIPGGGGGGWPPYHMPPAPPPNPLLQALAEDPLVLQLLAELIDAGLFGNDVIV